MTLGWVNIRHSSAIATSTTNNVTSYLLVRSQHCMYTMYREISARTHAGVKWKYYMNLYYQIWPQEAYIMYFLG